MRATERRTPNGSLQHCLHSCRVPKTKFTSFEIRPRPDWPCPLASCLTVRGCCPPHFLFRFLQLPYGTRFFESGPVGLGAICCAPCSRNVIAPQALLPCGVLGCCICTAGHRFGNIGWAFPKQPPQATSASSIRCAPLNWVREMQTTRRYYGVG